MGNIVENITIKDAICKDIYGENAKSEDYTNEEVIAKLETDKSPDEIIYEGGENEIYTSEEVIAKLKLGDHNEI